MPEQRRTDEELESCLAETEAFIESLRSQRMDGPEEGVEPRTIQPAAVDMELRREIGEHLKILEGIQLLSAAVEQCSDGIAITDPDGNLLFVNGAFARIHGYEQDELAGKHLRVFHTEEQMPAVEQANRVLRDTGEYSGEVWHVRRDGQVFPTLMHNSLLRDESGIPVGMIGTLRDITERKRTEDALRESEQRYREIFDNVQDAIFTIALDGTILFLNPAWEAITGLPRTDWMGMSFAPLVHPDDLSLTMERFESALKGQCPPPYEARFKTASDQYKTGLFTIAPRFQDGEVIAVVGIGRDITERKRAEEALLLRNRAVDSAAEGISITDSSQPDHPVIYVNQGFERLTGYDAADILGKNMGILQGPDTDPETIGEIRAAIQEGRECSVEFLNYRKDGTPFWNRATITPVRSDKNEISHFIGVHADVTEQRQQQERTQLSLEVLQHLNSGGDKSELLDGILRRIKDHTGVEGVGIRLRKGDDFPYCATNGFPNHFVDKERYVCARDKTGNLIRDPEGNPMLECLCGNVLCRRIDPSQPFFSDGGSFWTNSTTELFASATDEQLLTHPRGRCHGEGYESVALIPVRSDGETIGLLQLNDRRPGQLTQELIEFLERLGHSIGIALHRADAAEALEASEARYKSLVENSLVGVNVFQDGRIVFANQSMAESLGYSVSELCSMTPDQVRGVIHPEDRERVLALAQARLAGENPPSRYIFRVIRKDGSVAWLENSVSLTTFNGRPASQGFSLDITERRQAEEALRETQQRYREIVDNVQDAIFTIALDGTILFLNPAWEAITGLPRAEWTGRSFASLVHPEDLSLTTEQFESALKGESPSPYEIRFKTGSDEYKTGHFMIAPRFKDGVVIAVVGIARDTTERKRAEERLRESEERYRTFVENFQGIAFQGRMDMTPVFFHGAVEEITGYTEEDFKAGRPRWDQVIHPVDLPVIYEDVEKIRTIPGYSGEYEYRIVRKDGRIRWVHELVHNVCDETGRPAFVRGMLHDITERKRAEGQVRRKAAVLQAINDVFREALTCKTEEQVGKTCLAVAEKLTGSKFGFLGELNAEGLMDTIAISNPGWDACKLAVSDARHLTKNMPLRGIDRSTLRDEKSRIVNQEQIATHPDRFGSPEGHPPINCFLGVPLKHRGKTIGMIGLGNKPLGYDAVDQEAVEHLSVAIVEALRNKRAEQGLWEREKELTHLGRLSTMGEMAAGIAHELKQPLSAITNYATGSTWHLQNATADPQELTGVMEKISAQARHASDIIDRLRSSVRKCEPRRSSTDINHLLTEVLKLVEHELRQESVSVHLDLQDKLPLVFADGIQIQQVVLNLIRNALDAMRGDSQKERQLTLVTSVADGDMVEVCVGDTGTGLSEEVRRRIFEAYYTTKAEGLGMGLAISQTIIKAHEGQIWATSNSPHGTVFHLLIPTLPKRD